jgi:hypothetical protein
VRVGKKRDWWLWGALGVLALGVLGGAPQKRLTLSELVQLAREAGFPDPELAAAVAYAESGGRPHIVIPEPHGSPSFGLWQIHWSDHKEYDPMALLHPEYNARAALAISRGGTDFSQWSTFKNGLHLPYYKKAA